MEQLCLFKSDFVSIIVENINNAEIVIVTLHNTEKTFQEQDWIQLETNFKKYYDEHLTNTEHKYIMLIKIETSKTLSLERIKKISAILKERKSLVIKHCIFTTFIINSKIIKQLLNVALTFYKNERPVFFETDYEKTYNKILEHISNQETVYT